MSLPTSHEEAVDRVAAVTATAAAAGAHAAIIQAVLSAGGRPSFARTASEVFPRIYIADITTARTPAALRDLAITHVLSVLDYPVGFPSELALKTMRVPLRDLASADLLGQLPGAVKFLDDALLDPCARVLVHCWQGVSRSPSVVAAYLIASHHMSADEAIALLKSKRRIVQPNAGFLKQLRQYEVEINDRHEATY